jgi:hypothetical protein
MTLRINARAATALHPLDAYMTPPEAVRALLTVERLPASIADPCCGDGAILNVLKAAGHIVHGADVMDYGWPWTLIRDYLAEPVIMNGVGIVTNPPFRLAERFIRKAITDGCHYHAWLLRLNFLESVSRRGLWRESPPARIWVSSRRLPMMHRHGWDGPRSTSNVSYAWFVWDGPSNNNRRAEVDFFDWRECA